MGMSSPAARTASARARQSMSPSCMLATMRLKRGCALASAMASPAVETWVISGVCCRCSSRDCPISSSFRRPSSRRMKESYRLETSRMSCTRKGIRFSKPSKRRSVSENCSELSTVAMTRLGKTGIYIARHSICRCAGFVPRLQPGTVTYRSHNPSPRPAILGGGPSGPPPC